MENVDNVQNSDRTGFRLGAYDVNAISMQGMKDWHQSVSYEFRCMVLYKSISSILSKFKPQVITDPAIGKVIAFFKRKEIEWYKKANSQSQYICSIARVIYRFSKEFENKWLKETDNLAETLDIGKLSLMDNTQNKRFPLAELFSSSDRYKSKEWQFKVTQEFRKKMQLEIAKKCVLKREHDTSLNPGKTRKLVPFAKRIESKVFEAANSVTEYCRLIAKEIVSFRKYFKNKRERRQINQIQDQMRNLKF